METGYTVAGLSPSTDTIPYQVNGRLYESMVTVEAVQGWANPVIPFFNARAVSGQTTVCSPMSGTSGVSGAAVPQGSQSSGKIYLMSWVTCQQRRLQRRGSGSDGVGPLGRHGAARTAAIF